MAKRIIKINIKLPEGVVATKELAQKATEAAEQAIASTVNDLAEAQKIAKDLESRGFNIPLEDILNSRTGTVKAKRGGAKKAARKTGAKKGAAKKAAKKKGTRTRTVLSDEQREALVAELREGVKTAELVEKYGVSSATIAKLKSNAGLTKSRNA